MSADKETNRRLFLELVKNGSSKREAAESLGIAGRTSRRWWAEEHLRIENAPIYRPPMDKTLKGFKRFVITSVLNDQPTDKRFYSALKRYCKIRQAKLIIVPVQYEAHAASVYDVDPCDLFFENVQLCPRLRLLTRLKLLPTLVDPLAGLAEFSDGNWLIIPHPRLEMRSLPVLDHQHAQMWTTATVSIPRNAYSKTKTGHRAEKNHTVGAVVVELGENPDDHPHVRDLCADEKGGFFDDLTRYDHDETSTIDRILSINLGDTHVAVLSKVCHAATFSRSDSMVQTLRPKSIVYHDILDCQCITHWDTKNWAMRVGKRRLGLDSLERELNELGAFAREVHGYAGPDTEHLWVDSNHPAHLMQWLSSKEARNDEGNWQIFTKLWTVLNDSLEKIPTGVNYGNPFKLWIENSEYRDILGYTTFLSGSVSYKIGGKEVSQHGHYGSGGAKGSPKGFAAMPFDSITGHGHGPGIYGRARRNGTSSELDLVYVHGASNWMHTHTITYPNGQVQTRNIVNGEWRGPPLP